MGNPGASSEFVPGAGSTGDRQCPPLRLRGVPPISPGHGPPWYRERWSSLEPCAASEFASRQVHGILFLNSSQRHRNSPCAAFSGAEGAARRCSPPRLRARRNRSFLAALFLPEGRLTCLQRCRVGGVFRPPRVHGFSIPGARSSYVTECRPASRLDPFLFGDKRGRARDLSFLRLRLHRQITPRLWVASWLTPGVGPAQTRA